LWCCIAFWHFYRKKGSFAELQIAFLLVCSMVFVHLSMANSEWYKRVWGAMYLLKLMETGLPYYLAFGGATLTCVVGYRYLQTRSLRIKSILLGLLSLPVIIGFVIMLSRFGAANVSATGYTLAVPHPPDPITNSTFPGMVFVPAGPFLRGNIQNSQLINIMGNDLGDEQPVSTICLNAFYIDKYEVSNAQFSDFVAAVGYVTDAERVGYAGVKVGKKQTKVSGANWKHPAGAEDSIKDKMDHPVVQVSWNDAKAYCNWNKKRLPSEAEWEKAARGVDGRIFPWGNEFEANRLHWGNPENVCVDSFAVQENQKASGIDTVPVDSFASGASPYGAFNMSGNVWEWVNDWYEPNYYEYASRNNPKGPSSLFVQTYQPWSEPAKSLHGGSYLMEDIPLLTVSSRSYDPPHTAWRGVGFRCATTAE